MAALNLRSNWTMLSLHHRPHPRHLRLTQGVDDERQRIIITLQRWLHREAQSRLPFSRRTCCRQVGQRPLACPGSENWAGSLRLSTDRRCRQESGLDAFLQNNKEGKKEQYSYPFYIQTCLEYSIPAIFLLLASIQHFSYFLRQAVVVVVVWFQFFSTSPYYII